jgi:hypothetical protein
VFKFFFSKIDDKCDIIKCDDLSLSDSLSL